MAKASIKERMARTMGNHPLDFYLFISEDVVRIKKWTVLKVC